MLMQNFKSAADLRVTEPQRDALQKTLALLETDQLRHVEVSEEETEVEYEGHTFCGNFNMRFWAAEHSCGTAACIGGTAELIGNVSFTGWMDNPALKELFWPHLMSSDSSDCYEEIKAITPEQAATALRSYLTTGDARWDLAVA